jgi:hypothetical protein
MWEALSSPVILGSWSHGTFGHILLSLVRDFPNLEGQVPVFISPQETRWPSYTPRPQALGFLFVASYDSQGYGGGTRPLVHAGFELSTPLH